VTLGHWKKVREMQGAEIGIEQHKQQAERKMALTKTPKVLWDCCGVRVLEGRLRTAHPLYLHGRTPYEHVTGEMLGIT
jgi:hypothetical protein